MQQKRTRFTCKNKDVGNKKREQNMKVLNSSGKSSEGEKPTKFKKKQKKKRKKRIAKDKEK